MNPVLIVGTVNGVLSLLDQLLPVYREAVARGEISVEQQTAMLARIELYRSGAFFLQPHWQLPPASPEPAPAVTSMAPSPTGIPVVSAPVTVIAPPAP